MGMRGGPRVAFVPAVSMLHRSFNGAPRGASRLMLPVASASAQFAPGPKTHVPLQLERVARSTSNLLGTWPRCASMCPSNLTVVQGRTQRPEVHARFGAVAASCGIQEVFTVPTTLSIFEC